MYTFEFTYSDKRYQCVEHIEKVEYLDAMGETMTVEDEAILSYNFPLNHDLHLFAKDANYAVSSDQLQYVSVKKE